MFRDHVVARARKARVWFALGALLIASGAAVAQTPIGPRPFAPPSYPGNVPPIIQGYEVGQYSSGFNFSFTVNLTEVQKFLPAGYTAIPTAPGGTTTGIVAIFGYQTLITLTSPIPGFAAGTYGPFETFDLSVACFGPPPAPGLPPRFELVFLTRFVNNAEIVDLRNAFGGPGETRFADIEVRMREGAAGQLRMRGKAEDADSGLKVAAVLTGPAEIVTQLRHQSILPGVPVLPLRAVNSTVSPPTPSTFGFFTASSELPAPLTDPAALDVNAQQLRLAGGKIKILGVVPGSFFLNQEILFKKSF